MISGVSIVVVSAAASHVFGFPQTSQGPSIKFHYTSINSSYQLWIPSFSGVYVPPYHVYKTLVEDFATDCRQGVNYGTFKCIPPVPLNEISGSCSIDPSKYNYMSNPNSIGECTIEESH
jgi:hypothetical protein